MALGRSARIKGEGILLSAVVVVIPPEIIATDTTLLDAKRYIQFALSLGHRPEPIRWVLRCEGDDLMLFEDRKRELRLPDGIKPKFVPVPLKSSASVYRKWIDIAFADPETGDGLMNVTTTTMYLAKISLSATEQE